MGAFIGAARRRNGQAITRELKRGGGYCGGRRRRDFWSKLEDD
jgi:hypothetical protein